jgi:hypothetical protein
MMPFLHSLRSASLACAAAALPLGAAHAAEPVRIVLQNNRSILLSAVTLQGNNLAITGTVEGFAAGQLIPLESVDHVFGDKPPELSVAVAWVTLDKPVNALKLLDPILSSQRPTAKFPGNFWLEAARTALMANAQMGNTAKCGELAKEIAEATPQAGNEPFEALAKVLLMPSATNPSLRETALNDIILSQPAADVCGYAAFFKGNVLKNAKKTPEALESYLTVVGLFPSGNVTLNAAAEFRAAEILAAMPERREEAVALLRSSVAHAPGTALATEATSRLESLK